MEFYIAYLTGLGIQSSSSAASNKNLVNEILVTLNALKSDIESSKGSSAKPGKVNCSTPTESDENQGIIIFVKLIGVDSIV